MMQMRYKKLIEDIAVSSIRFDEDSFRDQQRIKSLDRLLLHAEKVLRLRKIEDLKRELAEMEYDPDRNVNQREQK